MISRMSCYVTSLALDVHINSIATTPRWLETNCISFCRFLTKCPRLSIFVIRRQQFKKMAEEGRDVRDGQPITVVEITEPPKEGNLDGALKPICKLVSIIRYLFFNSVLIA